MTDSQVCEEFFRSPNVASDKGSANEAKFAHRFGQASATVKVLPWQEQGGRRRWYVVHSGVPVEQLREELVAQVGVSYTDFEGQSVRLDPNDVGDARAVAVAGDHEVVRIELLRPDGQHVVEAAFRRWLAAWPGRPWSSTQTTQSLAELLARFQLAIRATNRTEAEFFLNGIRESGELEIINVVYLELEFGDAFDGPDAVLSHPQLRHVLQVQRPARVSDLIARAVDRVHLRFDESPSLDVVLGRFATLNAQFRSLLISTSEVRSSSGLLLVALSAITRGESIDVQVGFDGPIDDLTRLAVEQVGSPVPSDSDVVPTAVSTPSFADLLDQGAYDEVLRSAAAAEPNVDSVEAALRAAQWLDSVSAAQQALSVLSAAPQDVKRRFENNRVLSPLIESLRVLCLDGTQGSIADWIALLQEIAKRAESVEVTETAKHGALEWTTAPVADDPQFCKVLAQRITEASEQNTTTFGRIVPYLIEWLDRVHIDDRRHLGEVSEALLAHFAFRDQSRAGLDMLGSYATDALAAGLSTDQYRFCLDCISLRWRESFAPSAAVWAGDMLEALIDQPCPDPTSRLTAAADLVRRLAPYCDRIDAGVLESIRDLACILGLEHELPASASQASTVERGGSVLTNRRIGLYSLTPGALARAKTSLEERYEGVSVETRSDHVATDGLRHLARNADLMVIAWRSATHAATDCIFAHRPVEMPTLRTAGKGSASILAAVDEWVKSTG